MALNANSDTTENIFLRNIVAYLCRQKLWDRTSSEIFDWAWTGEVSSQSLEKLLPGGA
jgi:hypothetical protein